ncbi:retrotransposon protein, putative, unclassified [Panicum miliaceum]|uniref:Retrotransposon protein, putative, unclassified n=1 Tax=Panicum miliaceum TaxID=4540 RepID=A0A3L6RW73_PANMI|nr:retrotransposon protein, putative, unclassified [Panicum miliaceum]
MVTDRFNLVSEYEVIGQFHNLKQVGSVVDYVDKFEEMVIMVRRNCPHLPETYYISSFRSGLKDSIQYHLQCHRPTALSQAYWYAKRLEQASPAFKKYTSAIPPQKFQKTWNKEKDTTGPSIAELRAAGKCFKCREPWVPGHTKVCKGKQLYSVILVQNAEGQEEVAVVEDAEQSDDAEFHDAEAIPTLNISMHALTGIPSMASTFALKLRIGTSIAVALVDSGSDESFMNAKFAVNSNCKISQVSMAKVAAANGKEMISNTACLSCKYSIQGHEFISDFRLLEVKGYDVILGADWIYHHNPVGLDLKRREFPSPQTTLKLLHS